MHNSDDLEIIPVLYNLQYVETNDWHFSFVISDVVKCYNYYHRHIIVIITLFFIIYKKLFFKKLSPVFYGLSKNFLKIYDS